MAEKCALQVAMIGINHKSADLPLLEMFSRGANALKGEKALFFPHPSIVLKTCNRIEIYFGAEDPAEAHSELLSFLRPHLANLFEHRVYSFFGFDCFCHLSRVASGLDSALVGESEIQGQVKRAYLEASHTQRLTRSLHYLFQKSLKVGKVIRQTLSGKRFELPDAVLQIAENRLGTFAGRSFLFIGNSRLNRSMIPLLKRKAPSRICLSTTTPDSFVDADVEVCDRGRVGRWREYDCVIAATTVDEPIVLHSVGSPTLLFDLGVPRNVDPALTLDPTVSSYNIEEIHRWMRCHAPKRTTEIEFAERLLKQEVAKLARLYRLKVGVAGVAGKWDHIPDVFHAARK